MLPAPAPTLVRSALDLVGGGCHGCGAPEHPACRACLGPLAAPRAVRPDPPPPGLPAVLVAAGAYEGGVRALLVAHKERGRLALARPLGAALAAAVRAALAAGPGPPAGGPVVLVPVPSRPGSARRRGHDPLLRLARVAAIRLRRDGADGADIRVAPVLRVQRRLLDQAGLDTAARWANLGGALAVPPALAVLVARARVVVVDDVVTTGATLAEATRALRPSGARRQRPPWSPRHHDGDSRPGREDGLAWEAPARPGGTRGRARVPCPVSLPAAAEALVDVVVRGRHCEVSDGFRSHTVEKVGRVHLDPRVHGVDVEVSEETNPSRADERYRVEITVRSKGPVVRAEAAADEKYAALDLAVQRLAARARRQADRRRVHHGSRTPVSVARATAGLSAADTPTGTGGGTVDGRVDGVPADVASYDGSGALQVDGDGPLVVREKTHRASPMSLDQALYEMELVGHDFFLFVDAASALPSVVYRRRGFDYGVIRLAV